MTAARLLDRLESVKQTGTGRWIAKCPSHEDQRASLSVRELDDGRVLVHDFAGCDVIQVLDAAGLTFDDLFPPRTDAHRVKGERRPFPAADVLRALSTELAIVVLYTTDIRSGGIPSHDDHQRFLLACTRISEAHGYSHGK